MAETYQIHYLENQFEVRSSKSSKLLMIVALDHIAKLAADTDPELVALYDSTRPAFNGFVRLRRSHLSQSRLQ